MIIYIFLLIFALIMLWFTLIRNVQSEHFPDDVNKIILKYNNQYLVGNKNKSIDLGATKHKAIYNVINNPLYKKGIQLESSRYPGYYITYHQNGWHLLSHLEIEPTTKSVFFPMAAKNNIKKVTLVNKYKRQCPTVRDKLILSQSIANKRPLKTQTFTWKQINQK